MRIALTTPLLVLALFGCNGGQEDTDEFVDTFEWPDCTDEDDDGRCAEDQDCDDTNPEIHAGRAEVCNGIDDNCNDLVDEGQPDADQDGTCDAVDVEECDGLDNDGDGLVDEDFEDGDGDGEADCVDTEVCDGIDNDGDGDIDEGFDSDGDGATVCGDIDGENVDCNDDNADVYPGALEVADTTDNDCDGLIDEGDWAPGDLVITEIMINPSTVGDPRGEWFEVFNATGTTVYLNGLDIQDSNGQSHQVSAEMPIPVEAGAYAVLGVNGRLDQNGRVPVDYDYDGVSLSNTVDDLQLIAIDERPTETVAVTLDRVAWNESFPVQAGASMMLEPRHVDIDKNDDALYWCPGYEQWELGTDLGSPGAENPTCLTFDQDGDGISRAEGDCDDLDPDVYPGAPEIDSSADNDCDGVAELGPVISAEVDAVSDTEECGRIYLDGTDSYDPDGGSIETWNWTITSQPSGSTLTDADIVNANTSFANVEPDTSGSFEFQLEAHDEGGAAGTPATVTVAVTARTSNTDPVADAGDNQVASGTTTCTSLGGGRYNCSSCTDLSFSIDGSRSRDREGDTLSYLWTVTSGAGVVADRNDPTTTVTVSGATPSPSSKATSTVFIDLVVEDCMGGTSTADTIAIVYTCEVR